MIHVCRVLAVIVAFLPVTSLVILQFMLLAGILLSMTMIPGICLRGMKDAEAHIGAIRYDIIKWTCSVLLLITAIGKSIIMGLTALEVEFATLAVCGMMTHNGVPRLILASAAGVGAGASYLWLGLGWMETIILLLASAVFVLMTLMWMLVDRRNYEAGQ